MKAFTDSPSVIAREIGQLQRLIKKLYVKKIVLIPRFDYLVKNCYESNKVYLFCFYHLIYLVF